ncbi:hypothetical protein DYD21_00095 [Rhodohalobacter sp. SW132]|uniref:hypothetical protein n=1 Tax=Rhodohalobacter sp. SW132 TaxID=2293433 RepID=UPI000E289536|nr:hypothetical protein [Rhodohalobacter sp. SW132]REL38394.1 hypothetical protein DYD21_00095 [Rhodohalobacter sp. SW132]
MFFPNAFFETPARAGMNGAAHHLYVQDEELIAGGWFTASSETEINYLARWDDDTWQLAKPVFNENRYTEFNNLKNPCF